MNFQQLPLPPHFDPAQVGQVWRVPYGQRAAEAEAWARAHSLPPAVQDEFRLCLVAVDVQNTFCIPEFELYVGGRSGVGAVDDNRRLCEFVYRNLGALTRIVATLDTHQASQIFHSIFLVNAAGEHPAPYTLVTAEDIEQGRWRFNADLAGSLGYEAGYVQAHLRHYTRALEQSGKYALTVWPYHALLGGLGHALVAAFEEAAFFHGLARRTQPDFEIKGRHALTEHYSVLGPEVRADAEGRTIVQKNSRLVERLAEYDALVVAGQAKSHCVAWTVQDLLDELARLDPALIGKIYLLEDCTSPVVVPGAIDYSDEADAAFRRFAEAGAHVVRSTDPIETWPGMAA